MCVAVERVPAPALQIFKEVASVIRRVDCLSELVMVSPMLSSRSNRATCASAAAKLIHIPRYIPSTGERERAKADPTLSARISKSIAS